MLGMQKCWATFLMIFCLFLEIKTKHKLKFRPQEKKGFSFKQK
jgi:hypothetical protein